MTLADDDIALVLTALNHYAEYLRATSRENAPYKDMRSVCCARGPEKKNNHRDRRSS